LLRIDVSLAEPASCTTPYASLSVRGESLAGTGVHQAISTMRKESMLWCGTTT
jgi:hypothetical protein